MSLLGLDIGGANTKAILLKEGEVKNYWYKHIPLWKNFEDLKNFLSYLKTFINPKIVGVTMTAELSDTFKSKIEGVKKVIKTVETALSNSKFYFLTTDGDIISKKKAKNSATKIAASNWMASATIVSKKYEKCLLADAGSTTLDLIPIKDGKPDPNGYTDYERLKTSELVYTGILRTPVSYFQSKMKLDNTEIRIASEYFANMGDVYRVLNLIDADDYNCETPDGRGKDTRNCLRRLAKTFCSDLNEMKKNQILNAAKKFRKTQISYAKEGIKKVINKKFENDPKIVATGIGRKILVSEAAKRAGFKEIIDLSNIYNEVAALMTPAFGVSMLLSEKIK